MRSLTDSEARVVQALIADVPGGESERIRASGVPRSTYHKIRRKAFVDGWVRERYVPDVDLLGVRTVSLTLAQPFAESRHEAIRLWRDRPGTVLLWAGLGSLFSVVFEKETPAGGLDPSGPPDWFRRRCSVTADPRSSGLPIYFDFEGAWSRWTRVAHPISYPIPLPVSERRLSSAKGEAPGGGTRSAALELLRPGPVTHSGDDTTLRTSPIYLPPAQQRLIREGWVTQRGFLDPARLPPYGGHRITHVVFATGLWRAGAEPSELKLRLIQQAKATPFLLAFDAKRVLLGLLAPRPPGAPSGTASLLDILQATVREVEIERESLDSLTVLIDHKYDGLLIPTREGQDPPSSVRNRALAPSRGAEKPELGEPPER